jgi:hypothetical protein
MGRGGRGKTLRRKDWAEGTQSEVAVAQGHSISEHATSIQVIEVSGDVPGIPIVHVEQRG